MTDYVRDRSEATAADAFALTEYAAGRAWARRRRRRRWVDCWMKRPLRFAVLAPAILVLAAERWLFGCGRPVCFGGDRLEKLVELARRGRLR